MVDGSASLGAEVQRDLDIRLVPQHVLFGDTGYTPGVDLTPADFYAKLAAAKSIPTTSAPSFGECLDVYRLLVSEGHKEIIMLTVIAEKSVTNAVAKAAADQTSGARIEVIDTRSVAGGLGLIATACARARRDGRSFDQAVELARRLAGKVVILALIDTLDYLKKGGRVSGASATFGSLLSIKPIVEVKAGEAVLIEKTRTHERGLAKLKELIEQRVPVDTRIHACALHTNDPERARVLGDWAQERFHCVEYWIAEAGPIIGTQAGPGVAGLCWYREEEARP